MHIHLGLVCRVSGPVPPTIPLNVSLVLKVWSCQHCSPATLDANSCVYLPMINTQVTVTIFALQPHLVFVNSVLKEIRSCI